MSIISITPSTVIVSISGTVTDSNSISLSSTNPSTNIVTINDGQQGPAGVSATVINYGADRVLTSNGTFTDIVALSAITANSSGLYVNGTGVSISGHHHNISDINGISGYISSGVLSTLSSLSTISNKCDIEYVVIQNSGHVNQLVNISNLIDAMINIDGGGVVNSGC